MTVPHEPMSSSRWPSQLLSDLHARGFTLAPWQRWMVESLAQGTTEPQLERRIAPTRRLRCVSVRYMLKPMQSHTRRDMEFRWQVVSFMPQIHPAIRALVFSSMQEYQPWFLCENIETTLAFDSWPTWA